MSIDSNRILVTGGMGFIGSYLTRNLLEKKFEVHVIDNQFTGDPGMVPNEVSTHNVDIRETQSVNQVISQIDPHVIIHLAAIHFIPYCNENPEQAFNVNVIGTRNVLHAAKALNDLDRFINASSAAVYSPSSGPHKETEETGPTDIYGQTKLVAEDESRLFHLETDIPTATARLFNAYGERETNSHLIPAILEQLEAGSRSVELGNLTPARDFIHVNDIANALTILSTEYEQGYRTYNVGTGTEYTVQQVVDTLSDIVGEQIKIVQDDDRVRKSDRPHLRADISRLRSEFDWVPEYSFREGLSTVVEDKHF